MRPEVIAQAARRRADAFAEQLALHADAIAEALERELHLVAWDREQLVGSVQARFAEVCKRRPNELGGVPERVVEWREQPLEAIDAVWARLLAGRRVVLHFAPSACTATRTLLAEVAASLPAGALVLDDAPYEHDASQSLHGMSQLSASQRAAMIDERDPSTWPVRAVVRAVARVAWIDATADRELAAYVLARTCLRRAGTDPRSVRRAFVVGPIDLLQRHLQRLWVGAQMGPASDPDSFAGPVDAAMRDAFVVAQAAWLAEPRATTWVEGGVLERADQAGPYLAPAAFACEWPAPEHALVGPTCCIVRCTSDQARAEIEAAAREGAQVVQVGGRPIPYAKDVRHIRGAVLVERLPPGLPEPRPV
jgi:hypothetical protein